MPHPETIIPPRIVQKARAINDNAWKLILDRDPGSLTGDNEQLYRLLDREVREHLNAGRLPGGRREIARSPLCRATLAVFDRCPVPVAEPVSPIGPAPDDVFPFELPVPTEEIGGGKLLNCGFRMQHLTADNAQYNIELLSGAGCGTPWIIVTVKSLQGPTAGTERAFRIHGGRLVESVVAWIESNPGPKVAQGVGQ